MTYKLPDWNNLTGIHFYSKGLEFPVAIAERSDWDRTQLYYINPSVHTTESMIAWCKSHNMDWKIVYPIRLSSCFYHPLKFLRYLRLLRTVSNC